MVIQTLARKATKVAFFLALMLVVARTLGPPELWFNEQLALKIGQMIYGNEEIGADRFYDIYFYMSVCTVIPITVVIYILTMKLIKKIRSK